ncbi:hypothetical protein [Rubritalea sp.]|uniref:hypothetical protein n=1 Tax=Rubritalea sp. TaxID=2109375 RepID=UPI003EFA0B24
MKKLFLTIGVAISSWSSLQENVRAEASQMDVFSVYNISDILHDRGVYTMVPKSAVMHVPRGMEKKLIRSGESQYVSFDQFMIKNSVWVHRMNVSVNEATGKSPIDPIRLEGMRKLGKVVIAVHKGEPISLKLTPVEPIAKAN